MKFMKKTLLLLLSVFALVLSLAIAACGSATPKITFETGGGSEIPPIEAEAGTDISALLPEEPVRDGYFFEGWYLNEACTGEAQELPTVMPEESVTYYAKWTEGTGAKLTLTTNDGGVLEKTSFNVKVGENLKAFLEDKKPTPKTGLTFAGWYRGANELTDTDTMPAAGLTLTAKYNATYTVEVYRQQTDETYVKDATDLSGTSFYGEPFSCDGLESIEVPADYKLGSQGRMETDRLGIGEKFSVYLSLKTHYILYNANVPEGERVVTDVMPMGTYVHGGTPKLGECGYVLSGHYRFIGWAATETVESANELLQPGDTVQNAGNLNLTYYAIWEKGYADVFDGGDVIYIDSFDPDVLHLEREGMEIKDGKLDADGSFVFYIGTGLDLKGKLIKLEEDAEDYTYFFYYRDDYAKDYTDMDGTDAILTMYENGNVEYYPNGKNSTDGKLTGTYSINGDGYFVFENEGTGGNFLFNLYTYSDGTERVVFRRQDMEEKGYYYDADANIILYLDGLGGLRYYYHKTNAEYTGYDGNFTYTAIGYYENHKDDGIFVAQTRDIVSILKQFTFKNPHEGTVSVTKADFPDLPADANVSGIVDMDDGVRGEYASKWGQSENRLELDGYGNGTFGSEEGTYQLFTWLWSMEEENGDTIATYYLVRFEPEGGGDITYFRMDIDYGEYIIDRTITAAQASAYTGATGRFDFDIDPDPEQSDDWFFVLNMAFPRAFVMIFENGDAEVWTLYGTAYPDENNRDIAFYVFYLEPALSRAVSKENDTYHFAPGDNTASGLNRFDFTLDEGAKTASVVLPEPHDKVTVDTDYNGKALTLDYTSRTAMLGTQEVDYWYTMGYIDLYTFDLKNGTWLYYWTDGTAEAPPENHKNLTFREIGQDEMYLARITPELEETSYIGMLFFVNGKPTSAGEQKKTYLAYMLDSGLYRVVGEGITVVGDHFDTLKDYKFTLTSGAHLSDMDNSEFEGYTDITFRLYDEYQVEADHNVQTFVFEHRELTYSNFTTDGYGTYTYRGGSQNYTGTISFTIGDETLTNSKGEGRLIYLTLSGTQETMILRVSNGSVSEVSDFTNYGDAGYWYLFDSNGSVRENTYLVFDGNGSAFLYVYDSMLNVTTVSRGTYQRTANFINGPYFPSTAYNGGGFMEYRITLPVEDKEGNIKNETQTYLLDPASPFMDYTLGTTTLLPVYQQLIPHRVGSFTVRGGGTIESVGYPNYPYATYTNEMSEQFIGNMYIGKVNTGTDDHSFTNDADGTTVHFWAQAQQMSPTESKAVSEDYYFNIEDGELVPLALPYGDYALYANGSVVSSQVLRLDGVSSATILINTIEVWRGTYEARGTSEFFFSGVLVGDTAEVREFTFRISSQASGMDTRYVFEEEDEETDLILTGSDWTVLVLNGYGDAHYINKYGDVVIGTYTIFDKANGYGAFESDVKSDIFRMQSGDHGTTDYVFLGYEQYAAAYYAADFSSVVLTGSRFIIEGVSAFYVVSGTEEATLYTPDYTQDGVTFAKREHIKLPAKNTTYTYNGKNYLAYTAGDELTFTSSQFVTDLTLKFTPDGADFAVAAQFAGRTELSGYRVVVTYENGKVKTMLTYLASTMDSRVEEYTVVLNYKGAAGGHTYEITPHENGTFRRYADKDATAPMEGNASIVINGGHVGAVNLTPKSGNALTVTLNIEDSEGQPLTYTGSLDDIRTESESDFDLGNVRAVTVKKGDNRDYVLRFWLDESGTDKRFIMHSVVIESTFTIEGIEVTFMQLWAGGTHYAGGKQLSLVGISAAESLTEMNIFKGALDENTAALVRNRFDPSSESNKYEAFVYTLTKDSAGFIKNAAKKDGDYEYSEVTTSDVRYTARFLYTGTATDFNVEYVLTFSSNNSINATFAKDNSDPSKKNVWTATTDQGNFRLEFTRLQGVGLTVTRVS